METATEGGMTETEGRRRYDGTWRWEMVRVSIDGFTVVD